MYDLKIIFQLKENKLKELEFSFVWSKNSKKYLSSFFDTQEFLKVQNDIMKDFNCTKIQLLTKIVIPDNIATFINSIKINIGLSLVGVITGEFLVSKAGLRLFDSIWRSSI